MRQLISLLLVVVLAVLVTLAAQGNAGKVLVFFGQYRIDMTLNFVVLVLLGVFVLMYLLMRAIRASSQIPGRFREYLLNKKQNALLQANTSGLIAYITGDELGAQKALKQAARTGLENDLSYLIRAMSAIQANQLELAESILAEEKAANGEHTVALAVLRAKIALGQGRHESAMSALDALDTRALQFPQLRRLRLFALIGLARWPEALTQYRSCTEAAVLNASEAHDSATQIYTGLCQQAGKDTARVSEIAAKAKPVELAYTGVIRALVTGLMAADNPQTARSLVQKALLDQFDDELLEMYHPLAIMAAQESLPVVEDLLTRHGTHIRLVEIAGDVCEQEQLWGKAIARFEQVYKMQPAAHIAGKLERLYTLAEQPEKARQWREKAGGQGQQARQLA